MKRILVALIAAMPLALGAGVAQARGPGHWGNETGGSPTQVVAVAGTIVSVDPVGSSFVANAFVPAGDGPGWGHGDRSRGSGGSGGSGGAAGGSDGGGRHGGAPGRFSDDFAQPWGGTPTTQQVTITTNGDTKFGVNGQDGTIADLAAGDRFVSLLPGSPGDSLQMLVANPALSVFAHTAPAPRQLYAFVGTVNSVNATADTVTVQVTNTVPNGLVPAADDLATFTVSASTLVVGGSTTNGLSGGSLIDVAPGDVVAGGLIGTVGETLTQVESSPLQVLIDFPTSASTTPTATAAKARVKAKAISQALTLFGYKSHQTHAKKSAHKRRGPRSHPKKP